MDFGFIRNTNNGRRRAVVLAHDMNLGGKRKQKICPGLSQELFPSGRFCLASKSIPTL